MKKIYTVNLDEEKVDELKVWLEAKGLSFSGYLNNLIHEQISAIKLYKKYTKNGDVSASSLLKMAADMADKITKEVKK